MTDVLVAEGLCRWFPSGEGRVDAVRDASLRVRESELVVVLGRSGAGKSTLLSLCGGLDRPDSGRAWVAGHEVARLRGTAHDVFLQRTVGWVFQTAGLLALLTAEENVSLALQILGRAPGCAAAEARMALKAVGLDDRTGHRGGELSGGEQQRVALARALVKAPALLVADEPTAQLDTETARTVLALIRKAAGSGTAVLMATHDEAAAEVADRALLMEDGILRER